MKNGGIKRTAELLAEIQQLRKSCHRLHRRAQRAESELVREGRRADLFARLTETLRRGTNNEQSHGDLTHGRDSQCSDAALRRP